MKSLNPKITDWRDQRVWLIGASSGIGAALIEPLRKLDARLILSARSESTLQQLAEPGEMVLPLDVSDAEQVQTASQRIESEWGGIDLVIYCAGVYTPMRAWNVDVDKAEAMLRVNLIGVYPLLQAILPKMLNRGSGGICLIASVAGYTGLPEALAYGPSKAALINLAENLYSDLSPKGIGVYLVNPGFVQTRLTDQNTFEMPALISSEQAAEQILLGLRKGQFEITFPKRFTYLMKWLSRLPHRLRFYLIHKAVQG